MLKNLTLIRLRSLIGSAGGKDGKPPSRVKMTVFALVMLYVAGTFAYLSGTVADFLAPLSITYGIEWLFFCLYFTVSFTMIFILSIFETKSQLFECRDNDLLSSMPIRPGYILLSRLFTVLILNLLEAVVLVVPALCMFIYHGGSYTAILGSLLMMLAIVPIATMLSTAIGYLIAYINSKVGKNSFVTLGICLVFLALYFVGYSKMMEGLIFFEGDGAGDAISLVSDKLGFLRFVGDAAMLKPLPIIAFILSAVIIFAVGYLILSRNYLGIISASHGGRKRSFKGIKGEGTSPLAALCKKELMRFFSSALYMLNGGIGVIFKVVLAVIAIVKIDLIKEIAAQFLMAGIDVSALLPVIAVVATIILSGTVSISSSALSLEGKSFWIVKSSPIRAIDLIHAKLFPHLLFSLPTSLIAAICLWIASGSDLLYLPFVIVAPLLADIFFASLGLFGNILLPKFDFDNEAQVVKQSAAAAIGVLGGMLIGIGIAVLGVHVALKVDGFVSALVITMLMLVLAVVFYLLLIGAGRRKLEKM